MSGSPIPPSRTAMVTGRPDLSPLAERPARPGVLRALVPGTPGNRVLRFGLLAIALIPTTLKFVTLLRTQPLGVDLQIPLAAAQRWVDGGQPYAASAFHAPPGAGMPYLYPPFVLPFLVPLLALPRQLVVDAWVLVCLATAVWALRRLDVPYRWVPVMLLAAPFSEGIISGNVELLLFAAFLGLFFRRGDRSPALHPTDRDPADGSTPAVREGALAASIAAFKGQVHAWLYLLLRRPRAAALGAAVFAAIVLLTLPMTGIGLWAAWVDQLRRAADPSWAYGGFSLGRFWSAGPGLAVVAFSVIALWFVPRRWAGVWIGVLSVIGAPSLHIEGLMFMVPAWLLIRREIALAAAYFLGWYVDPLVWLAIAIVAVTWTLGELRFGQLLEPAPRDTTGAHGDVGVALASA